MFVIRRLSNEYHLRGATGLARFLRSRIVRRRADLLFERRLGKGVSQVGRLVPLPAVVIDRSNVNSNSVEDVCSQILVGDNAACRDDLARDNLLFAGLDGNGKVITYAFVLFRTFYKRILGISSDVPLVGNCFTEPVVRGQRLYPRMLESVCAELEDRGFDRAMISCEPSNMASIKGIERAGFEGLFHITCLVVLWRIVLARRVESYGAWRAGEGVSDG